MMLSVNSGDKMLPFFEFGSLLPFTDFVSDSVLNELCSLDDLQTTVNYASDYAPMDYGIPPRLPLDLDSEDSLGDLLNLTLIDPLQISNEVSADEDSQAVPYHPFADHSYIKIENDQSYLPDEEEERNIDVWTREVEPLRPPPVALNRLQHRRNARRNTSASKSVSIRKAARVALKRTRSQCYEPSRKVKKIKNSVETTPSNSVRGSDYEDFEEVVKTRNRGAKFITSRAINNANSINSSSKGGKSEVQRTNHNRNEKKRREQMSDLMKKVRVMVPLEYFKDCKTEKAKFKASKQKILTACRLFVLEGLLPELKSKERTLKRYKMRKEKNIQLLENLQAKVDRMRARLYK